MEDQQVLNIIRRRLTGVEDELLVDPPTTALQFATAMAAIAEEMIRTYAPSPTIPVPAPTAHGEPQHVAGEKEMDEAQQRLSKTIDALPEMDPDLPVSTPAIRHEANPRNDRAAAQVYRSQPVDKEAEKKAADERRVPPKPPEPAARTSQATTR